MNPAIPPSQNTRGQLKYHIYLRYLSNIALLKSRSVS